MKTEYSIKTYPLYPVHGTFIDSFFKVLLLCELLDW